jgi:hypothetical protein
MRTIIFLIAFGLLAIQASAQERQFSEGFIPELTGSFAVSDNFSVTGKVESMHRTHDYSSFASRTWNYSHEGTKFQTFVAYSLHPVWKIAGGYQLEIEGGGVHSNRAIQQVSFVQRITGFRLGHRLRTDQTFYTGGAAKYRLRYRLSSEFALEGRSVDPGEMYMTASNELLLSTKNNEEGLENRFALALGHYLNRQHQIELALDYRTENYLENGLQHNLWLVAGWYMGFN